MPQCSPSRARKSWKNEVRASSRCGITSLTAVACRPACSEKVIGSWYWNQLSYRARLAGSMFSQTPLPKTPRCSSQTYDAK